MFPDTSDGQSFPAMKRLHAISEIAKGFEHDQAFTQKVRARLPPRTQ